MENRLTPGYSVRVDAYGDSPELSEALLALIRNGQKRAGTGLLWAMEADGDVFPAVGDVEIVVDHLNAPALITRVTRVAVVPYLEVTPEYAAIEGEGDGSLAYWRDAHWAFFSRECVRIGRAPSEAMPVVCSVFEVLSVVPHAMEDN
ncbi:MAG: ASCH domain-containing protein [Thermoflexales bacterium]